MTGVGSVLLNQYRLDAVIGQGGMGVVYAASHKALPHLKYAVKILGEQFVHHEDYVKRFSSEAFYASGIQHENVIRIHNVSQTPEGAPFHVMDYLEGKDLDCQVALDGPLPWRRVRSIADQICRGLYAIHRSGLVHRDIKPSNCFNVGLKRDSIKILDFGLVKLEPQHQADRRQDLDHNRTREGTVLGTPGYMSPEQRRGEQSKVDRRSDVFSCGVLLFYLLTGSLPIEGVSLREMLDESMYFDYTRDLDLDDRLRLSSRIDSALRRAMEPNLKKRFQTIREFHEELIGIDIGYSHDLRASYVSMQTRQPELRWEQKATLQGPVRTQIELCQADALEHASDVLILKYAQDHFGLDLAAAQRMSSAGIDEKCFTPVEGETYLFDSCNLIGAKNLLVVGTSWYAEFGYKDVEEIASTSLKRLSDAPNAESFREIAITTHGIGFGLDESEAFDHLFRGLKNAMERGEAPPRLKRISIVERDPRRFERLDQRLRKIHPEAVFEWRPNSSGYRPNLGHELATQPKPYLWVSMAGGEAQEDIYQYGIRGAAKRLGLLCERSDIDLGIPGTLDRVRDRIQGAAAVVVHLSNAAANESFALGLALGARVPTILLVDPLQPPAFDAGANSCIYYRSIVKLEQELAEQLHRVLGS